MKTTIDIADDLLIKAERVAHEQGTTLEQLVEEGLRLVLQRREEKLQPFEPHVVRGSAPPADVSWDAMQKGIYWIH
jgi:hypothetical protein